LKEFDDPSPVTLSLMKGKQIQIGNRKSLRLKHRKSIVLQFAQSGASLRLCCALTKADAA